ncbi:hypothetical protein NDU88_005422 [Pleurodeles waltl]|uniref:Uncharacterized protein n=1 Tax=Pleurodeles waltl TaxID=8319 RepID=A0AAV7TAR3_PLEWA|nr:hypothetical protein NDU88_005422 [Pleurodeles waltl]
MLSRVPVPPKENAPSGSRGKHSQGRYIRRHSVHQFPWAIIYLSSPSRPHLEADAVRADLASRVTRYPGSQNNPPIIAAAKRTRNQLVRDMLTRSTPAPAKDPGPRSLPPLQAEAEGSSDSDQAPVTQVFLASLFDPLKTDIEDLKKELSQDM